MKKIVLVIVILLTFEATVYASKTNRIIFNNFSDTLITTLSQLNLYMFKDLPIDSLIAHIPQNIDSMHIAPGDNMKKASILFINYPNNIYIEVRVSEFIYMNPYNPNLLPPSQIWSIPLMRKEKIAYIKIFNFTQCINGCENR